MFRYVFLGLSLMSSIHLSAQDKWSLERCMEHAMKNNLQIRQTENDRISSYQTLLQNRASLLPTVTGSASHNYNFGRNIDPFTNQFTNQTVQSNNFGLNGSLTLFNGLQVRNTIRQSRYEYMAAEYQLKSVKTDIAIHIVAAYLDILFNKELVHNSSDQLAVTRLQYERMNHLVEAGKMTQINLYELKSQLAMEEVQLIKNRNSLAQSYITLAFYLDLPADENFEVVHTEDLMIKFDSTDIEEADELMKTILETHPLVKMTEYRRLGTIQALKAARGRQSPRLSLNAALSTLYSSTSRIITGEFVSAPQYIGYTENTLEPVMTTYLQYDYARKPYGTQLIDNYNRFVGFTLIVPIVNGLQTRTSINLAKIEVENSELNLRITKRTMENDVHKAYTDVEFSLSNLKAMGEAVQVSEQAFRSAGRNMEVGLINSFEYSQAKTRFTLAQSEFLKARYDYLFKLKMLNFYKGIGF